jgi:hypothetical protein
VVRLGSNAQTLNRTTKLPLAGTDIGNPALKGTTPKAAGVLSIAASPPVAMMVGVTAIRLTADIPLLLMVRAAVEGWLISTDVGERAIEAVTAMT